MAIQTELLKNNTLIRHYSDSGKVLLQVETGINYDEAVDILPCRYTYEETDTLIEKPEIDELEDAIGALHILGVK